MSDARRINERYHLEQRVSSKDTGSVYRATDSVSGQVVAVKLIDADDLEDRRELFQTYAHALQSVHHPSLPRLLDAGLTTAGSAFLVTEFLQGADLGTLSDASGVRAVGLLLFAVDGLEALAGAGLAHGNLRSDNLYLVNVSGDEEVKLLGLGSGVLREPATPADDFRKDLLDFATMAAEVLGATMIPGDGGLRAELPAAATEGLRDPAALRSFLEDVLRGGPETPEARLTSWDAVRKVLRRALAGQPGRTTEGRRSDAPLPGSGTVRVSLSQLRRQVEEQHGIPSGELKTRVFRAEDLVPAPPPPAPPAPEPPPPLEPPLTPQPVSGTVRVDLRSEAERLRSATAIPPAPPKAPTAPKVQEGTFRLDLTAERAAAAARATEPELESLSARRPDTVLIPVSPPLPPTEPPAPPPPPLKLFKAPAPMPPPPPEPHLLPAATPAAAPWPPVAPPSPAGKRQPSVLLLAVFGGLGLLLLLSAGGFLAWKLNKKPPALPPPKLPVVLPKTTPPPVVQTMATPPPINPQIPLAEGYAATGDLAKAQDAIAAIPANQVLTPEEQERVQRVLDSVASQQAGQEAGRLAKALGSGDAQTVRAAVEAIQPAQEAALPRSAKRDLARARRILDLDAKLARTEKEGHPLETVRQASALLAEQPKNSRALRARDDAAANIEAEAEAKAQAAQLDAAATRLEQLRDAWPTRHGLAEHIERLRAEDRANREMDDVLANASRAGLAGKPLEGLRILRSAKPTARFADRFREAQTRLEQQFAQLDRRTPEVELRKEADKLAYDKGTSALIPLRITDDYGVEAIEGWARPEGGQYTRIDVRKTGATDYEMEIPPSLHDNKTIDLYVTAIDRSGHKGQLGSAGRPIQIKRKGFLSKIFGKKD